MRRYIEVYRASYHHIADATLRDQRILLIGYFMHGLHAVFIFRFWSMWLNVMNEDDLELILFNLSSANTYKNIKKTANNPYFITNPAFFSIEINAHSLVFLASVMCEDHIPYDPLNIRLFNSQTCESLFRSARSMSSKFNSGVNFSVQQFFAQANKISVLREIKDNTFNNGLRFPHHRKRRTTTSYTPIPVNCSNLSKNLIEQTVIDAYHHGVNLLTTLHLQ